MVSTKSGNMTTEEKREQGSSPAADRDYDPLFGRRARTVNDFETDEDLRMALTNMRIQSREDCDEIREAAVVSEASQSDLTSDMREFDGMDDQLDDSWDWTLTNYDKENSLPPSLSQEVLRLQSVKSFQMIEHDEDSPKEILDRLSKLGQRLFQVPICTINLLDMGRAWILSGQGVGDIRESARKEAWCNHTIRYKADLMVIPDASQDWRFCDSPHVTGPFHLRFYAGASIVSPEGFRVGEFCVMGCQERPGGLTEDEQATLIDLAALAGQALAERRELNRWKHLLATMSHDVLTPIHSLKHSLSSLQPKQTELLGQTRYEADDVRMHELTVALVAAEVIQDTVCNSEMVSNWKAPPLSKESDRMAFAEVEMSRLGFVNMKECIQQLFKIIDPLPKKVPVMISVDTQVPATMRANKIQILRGALQLLSNACENSTEGPIHLQIVYDRKKRRGQKDKVTFECYDSRSFNTVQRQGREEAQRHHCLFSNLGIVSSHGLDFSYNQRLGGRHAEAVPTPTPSSTHGFPVTDQVTFAWFSIPLIETPRNLHKVASLTDGVNYEEKGSREVSAIDNVLIRPIRDEENSKTDNPSKYDDAVWTQEDSRDSRTLKKEVNPSPSLQLRRKRETMECAETIDKDVGVSEEMFNFRKRKRIKFAHRLVTMPNHTTIVTKKH